ncbi:Cna protein B-type domain-containing protein [Dehalogenimonas formicexedens]|uniref:Cna protein B-type domain-containing protein n=1 Tax=Dehalogenimonas formicexedens TaxID=1839801 RepID=A0A1P8F4T7_9CHLR|nr:SdrD B-like domain-containing protein [Dehalogenimonas formicexedens]APV43494.1 Cna protein B-type domain-containing protein [Dehalogenimonas formicexedens]
MTKKQTLFYKVAIIAAGLLATMAMLFAAIGPTKTDAAGGSVTQTSLGWRNGPNAQVWGNGNYGEYPEGDYWQSQILITNGTSAAIDISGFGFILDFYNSGTVGVDWVKNLAWSMTPSAYFVAGDGPSDRYPYTGHVAGDDIGLSDWKTGWTPFTPKVINMPWDPGTDSYITTESQTAPAASHFWGGFDVNPPPTMLQPGESLAIYFEPHLALTFIWSHGAENLLPQIDGVYPGSGGTPTTFDRPWTAQYNGAGFYPGSSLHGSIVYSGLKTFQLPSGAVVNGVISGYKYNDKDVSGTFTAGDVGIPGWPIKLYATVEGVPITVSTVTDSNGFYQFTNLPYGTYSVKEAPENGASIPAGYENFVHSFPANGTISGIVLTSPAPVSANNNFFNYGTGKLTVTKSVVLGSVVNPAGISETFTIHVTGPGGYSHDITFTLTNGVLQSPTSVTLEGLIPGSYTVSEDNPGAEWTVTGGGSVTVNSGQTATSTVTNTFKPGSLEITKVIDFNGAVNSASIDETFTVKVVGPSYPGEGTTHQFVLDNGAIVAPNPWLLTGLIPGDYTITEVDAGAEWTETVPASAVAVSAGGVATADVTNDYVPGSLEITKVIDFNGAVNSASIDETFTVKVVGPSYPGEGTTHQFVLDNGAIVAPNPWLLTGLIPGDYTITEVDAGAEWTETVPASAVAVSAGVKATADVTNDYVPGSLEITKIIDFNGAVNSASIDETFTVKVVGPSYPGEGTTHQFVLDNGAIVAPNPWLLTGLIPGDYTITEVDAGAEWTETVPASAVAVSAGVKATADVTNDYVPGSLEITKVIDFNGAVNSASIDETFTVKVVGPSYPGEGTTHQFVLDNGAIVAPNPWLLTGLIPGDYTITEVDAGAEWTETVPASAVAVSAGGVATADVTNDYVPGSLEITKVIDFNGAVNSASIDETFTVKVVGPSYPGEGTTHQFVLDNGAIVAPNPWLLTGLIPGDYTITEVDAGAEWTETVPASAVAVSAGVKATADVTNDYVPGSLEITKVIDFNGAVNSASIDETFTVKVVGPSYPGEGTTHQFVLDNGAIVAPNPWLLTGLIPGDYTITEVDAGAEWTETVPASAVAVSAGVKATADVTNDYVPGSLEITKIIDFNGAVNSASIDETFTVKVVGPSYPGEGTTHQFVLDNGAIVAPNPWLLTGLIPGDYTITEVDAGAEWTETVPASAVAVSAGVKATADVTNDYVPGSLEITKVIDFNGAVNSASIDETFTVKVVGPSYPGEGTTHQFVLDNGAIVAPNPWLLTGLIPGDYTITEVDAGAEWTETVPASAVAVSAGGVATADVTNDYVPGSLEITKVIDFNGAVNSASIDETFTVKVVGPSYPGEGTTHQFVLDNGAIVAPNPWLLTGLIPGDYTITEVDAGAEWTETVPASAVAVSAGVKATADVTNDYVPGSLEITKIIDFNGAVNSASIDETFTVKVVGPSYPGEGTTHQFVLDNGAIVAPNPWLLTGLIPGDYTITEVDAGAEWTETVPASAVAVSAGGVATADVTNDYVPGSLEITKVIDFNGAVNSASIDETFTVKVVGPSYPGEGTTHQFVLDNGAIVAPNPWLLTGLIPGDYTITEVDAGAEWTETVPASAVAVSAGVKATADVTNDYVPGSLEITKIIDFNGAVNSASIDETFTVKVVGPSYPGEGTTHQFVLDNGAIVAPNPWLLTGLIPGDYTITEVDAGAEWTETVPASAVAVSAGVKATADVTNDFVPGSLTITKVVVLGAYPFASTTTLDFTVKVTGPSYPGPDGTTLTFNLVNGVISGAQTLDNLIPGVYTVTETDPGVAWTVTNLTGNVTVDPGTPTATRTITNTLKQPNTTVTIGSDTWETFPGGNVTITVTEENTGDVPLSNVSVVVTQNDGSPLTLSAPPTSGDANTDGILDTDETWTWVYLTTISVDTTFQATGHGTDPLGNDITVPNYPTEQDDVFVEVNGATRTIGFWKTHWDFTEHVFTDPTGLNSNINLGTWGGKTWTITTMEQLMGLLWANTAKNADETSSSRLTIDQAKIHTAQQALAAILNDAMAGGAPLPVTLTDIVGVLEGNSIGQVRSLGSTLDAYNNSGDNIALDPSLPPTKKGDEGKPKDLADIPWANTTPEAPKGKK